MLKYGVVVATATFKAWQLSCVDELESSGYARLACVIHAAVPEGASLPYEAYCAKLNLPSQAPVAISALREKQNDIVEVDVRTSSSGQHWKDAVRLLDLDFVLLFGDREFGLHLTDVAKYGVWHFAHSDVASFTTDAPCFWEIYRGCDVTGAMLLKIEPGGAAGVVLKSAHLRTIRDSFALNVELAFDALPAWPVQVCRDIISGADGYFVEPPISAAPTHYGAPSALQVLALRALQQKNAIAQYLQMTFHSIDWNVFYLRGTPGSFIGKDAPAQVASLLSGAKGSYLADPCLMQRGSQTYLFCEEFRYRANRGVVVAIEIPRVAATQPQDAIDEPHHLSYPHVFEHEGEAYCIAEAAGTRRVELYRAVTFPFRWERTHTLLRDFRAIDSTLLKFADKWWLFCTSGDGPKRGDHSHLHIFHADDLFGPWTPHVRNPVKIDVRSSRPAGRFFTHDGALYRPAQDCSRSYGGAIRINKIEKISETDFVERVAGTIRPPLNGYGEGIHTISSAGGWCVVDAKRYVFRPAAILDVLKLLVKSCAYRLGVREEALRALMIRVRREPAPVARTASQEGAPEDLVAYTSPGRSTPPGP